METTHTVTLLFSLLVFRGVSGSDWSYRGSAGPEFWHKDYVICSGHSQSPINIIPSETVHEPTLTEFAIWFNPPHPGDHMVVYNNGHTVTIKTVGKFFVANGGLPNIYKTSQIHFHWGSNDHEGSEHQINAKAYPAELHIVNYDHSKYSSLAEAADQPLGLAVLGVMFQMSDEDNPALQPIIDVIEEIQKPDNPKVKIPAQSVRAFLPEDISRYYRYNGSLTTPGCYESVIWTVFEEVNFISYSQISKLRNLFYNKGIQHHHHQHKDHTTNPGKDSKDIQQTTVSLPLEDTVVIKEGGEVPQNDGIFPTMERLEIGRLMRKHHKKHQHRSRRNADDEIPEDEVKKDEVKEKNAKDLKLILSADMNNTVLKEVDETHSQTFSEIAREIEAENIRRIERIQVIDNYRPVQNLNNRMILRSFPSFTEYNTGYEIQRKSDDTKVKSRRPGNAGSTIGFSRVVIWSLITTNAIVMTAFVNFV